MVSSSLSPFVVDSTARESGCGHSCRSNSLEPIRFLLVASRSGWFQSVGVSRAAKSFAAAGSTNQSRETAYIQTVGLTATTPRGPGSGWVWRRLCLTLAFFQLVAVQSVAFEPLPRTAPEALGIDSAAVDRFLRELDRVVGAQSVVVVHRDQVVAEAYWSGSASTLRHVRSVTKSVSSTLIGIAVDRGFIDDIDARMVDYLPANLVPADAAKDQILLRHLLTHTSGFEWEENREFSTWAGSNNPVRFILNRPLVEVPGSDFNYSTPGSHVLSAILREASGLGVEDFAEAYLFAPLGISTWRWEDDPQGFPFGGHGLELRTEDMAKLGILFLNRGRWGDRQVVPADWVRSATAVQYRGGSSWGSLDGVSYGHLWWIAAADESDIFMALGWGGQIVFCVPALDLVVATNADWRLDAETADAHERAILEVIVEDLLPIIPVRHRPPYRASGRTLPSAAVSAKALMPEDSWGLPTLNFEPDHRWPRSEKIR